MPTARVSAYLRQDGHGPRPVRRHRPDRRRGARRAVQARHGATWATPRTSVNQGGASGSTGIQLGGKQMRMAAAEARRVLVEMAAEQARRAGRPAHRHRRRGQRRRRRRQEGDLCRADRRALFQRRARLEQASTATRSTRPARRSRRSRASTRSSASRIKREDIAPKVFAQEDFVHRREGARHGARPHDPAAGRGRGAGARSTRASIKDIPGAKVVWQKGFLGVVADKRMGRDPGRREAQGRMVGRRSRRFPSRPRSTITSARRRCASARSRQAERQCRRGVQDRRAGDRGRVRMAVPVACQHGAGLRAGRDQGRQGDRAGPARRSRTSCSEGVAAMLGVPADKVRVDLQAGPGSYGRNDADDAAMDAAVLAQGGRQAGAGAIHARPGHRLGPQGPGLDPHARAPRSMPPARSIAYEFTSKGFSRVDVDTNGSKPCDTLAGQIARRCAQVRRRLRRAGRSPTRSPTSGSPGRPSRRCSTAPRRCAPRICAIRSGRRSTSPANPSSTRWRRRLDVDPVEFRLRYIKDARDIARDQGGGREGRLADAALAARATRPAARCAGRGIAYSQRNGTRVAVIAEVEVDRATGKIWARRFTVAHDCGQIINPDGAGADASRATSCRASAARCGRRSRSTART